MKELIEARLKESAQVKASLCGKEAVNIERACRFIIDSLRSGGKVLIFGNGGSASDSQHMAAELVGRFKMERQPLPAIALTTNTSTITAIANDYSYALTFSRQVEALGSRGDIAVGISTSGNSRNVVDAVKCAKAAGLKTICLTGKGGGALKGECDVCIAVASEETPRVQEAHITIIHIICELVEKAMFK